MERGLWYAARARKERALQRAQEGPPQEGLLGVWARLLGVVVLGLVGLALYTFFPVRLVSLDPGLASLADDYPTARILRYRSPAGHLLFSVDHMAHLLLMTAVMDVQGFVGHSPRLRQDGCRGGLRSGLRPRAGRFPHHPTVALGRPRPLGDDRRHAAALCPSESQLTSRLPGKRGYINDYLVHLLRTRETITEEYNRQLTPQMRKVISAYADGLNFFAYLHSNRILDGNLFPISPQGALPVPGSSKLMSKQLMLFRARKMWYFALSTRFPHSSNLTK